MLKLKLGVAKRSFLFPRRLSVFCRLHQSLFTCFSFQSPHPNHHPISSSGRDPLSPISLSSDSTDPHTCHAFILKYGLEFNYSVATDLLLAYFINRRLYIALSLFGALFEGNIYSFNSTLKELSSAGLFENILHLYCLLRLSNSNADNFTYPYVLKACASLSAVEEGALVHSEILKCGFGSSMAVANSLIDMYSKCGSVQSARQVFDNMPRRNLVTWNCMISGYGWNGLPDVALDFCSSMKSEGMVLDKVGLKIVLPACGQLRALGLGKSVHAHVVVSGFSLDTVLVTAIMDMYAKCGSFDAAEKLFNEISCKDVVTWNAIITGYSQRGELERVIKLFHVMQIEGVAPSVVTVLIALQACADLGSFLAGSSIHGYIIRLGLSSEVSIESLLINMYSKCGRLNMAYQVFSWITNENVNSWTAIIHGLGMHGYGEAALMAFFKMLKKGMDPDAVSFLTVLSSCGHTGLIKEGFRIFDYMVRQFGIEPKMEHYVTMVDLMGRAGLIDEAFQFIGQMPMKPDINISGAFLGACRIHDDLKMAKLYSEQVVDLDMNGPTAGYYKLLLSIHASKEAWNEVLKLRSFMEDRGIHKISGCSTIEITVHS
ncbi:PREDICTED: pentatricopeptide repeat-containing protein DOT4, chloroplastic-like [Nelumbo nucifera]|uniref:Pentatricopeptide repeat-containing protein DOT4, chloroplastic-like n=1 Tax=Nelumbo nucifera TaxID=4432 RepID=A0A1U7Z3T7_NELNU|nr:PREDICTED: pentatricopeptide repeat-containing protein DOT4, chloroplastic-like [Nelumbo nucifera]